MKKNDVTFIRFGGLSPINQKKSYKTDTFHSAPCKKGFYAFVSFLIEPFLLGGFNPVGTRHSKRVYVKDHDNKKVILGKHYKGWIDNEDGDEWYISCLEKEDDYEYTYKKYGKQKKLFMTVDYCEKTGYEYLTTLKPPKKFKYTKNLWHHLGDYCPRHEIIDVSKQWVLTDFNTYVKALTKALHDKRKIYDEVFNSPISKTKYKQFNKDEFEVFIEKL